MVDSPPLHGQLGVVDELLLFCLPVVVAIVVLAITSQRARRKEDRSRVRSEQSDASGQSSREVDNTVLSNSTGCVMLAAI